MSDVGGYQVRIKRSAERELSAMESSVFSRISRAIMGLKSSPRPHGAIKLHGRSEYRLRVGVYRVIYSVDDAKRTVEVIAIRHRKDVYRP